MDFIVETLAEFDNLHPSALDTVFEYKQEDQQDQIDSFWQDKDETEKKGITNEYFRIFKH